MCFLFPHTPDKFTSTEKMILEYMSSHRDEFLFMTIGQLSAALNISEATVSRFARHVGCDDFKHLKQIVMEQTVRKGPAQKLTNTLRSGNGELLCHCIDQQRYNLQKTLELLDQKEFDRAVRAMLAARCIFIHAKNASRSLAQLLEFRLRRIGLDVRTIPAGGSEVLEGLVPIQREDLVILFGFSKVSSEGRVILDYGKEIGFTTLLFTGRLYPEKEQQADIHLFVYRGEENEYHSMSAPAVVVDALVIALSAQMGAEAVENLDAVQMLKERYRKQI
ncbi:MAG: MurR/RpiR family transcriptional regulator [Blautia sp.]|nr:MurR/RpiR family transcriptional regulator [Blautia sp.]MDY3997618.1 MurR/RpiR family transcriptional regulator [Blautia sp.]